MRQYERRIKFIRVGDAVRTAGWLKGEPMLSRRPWSIFYPGYMMQDRDLVGHLLIGWGTYTGFGERKANTFSLCGVGGETGYTAQEDLKFINSYNMGEGRTIRVLFFPFLLPRPSLGFFFFFPVLLSLGHHISQHQSLFQWVGSSHQVPKVLELQLQHQSFQWILRVNLRNCSKKAGWKFSIYVIMVKVEYMQSSTYFSRRLLLISWSFLLVLRNSHHHEGF